jgi:acyl dehydratase
MTQPVPSLAQLEDRALYFDDLAVGESFTTGGRTVTEADIVNFAGLSGDYHSLHMDAEYAATTPLGRRIAHGMLVVAMTSGLVAKLPLMRFLERTTIGLAGVSCRFLKPVFIGDTIRVDLQVAEKVPGKKPDRGTVVMRRSVRNQHGELVIEGDWKIVLRLRPAQA